MRRYQFKELTFELYCQFIIMLFSIAGIMMFFYCVVTNQNIIKLHDTTNPILYLGLSLMYVIIYLMKRYESKIKGEDDVKTGER